MLTNKPGTISTSEKTNSPIHQNPITSHQQRFDDRRLIERRRIHHNPNELHKLTQIKQYEIKKIKEDERKGIPYLPKFNKYYIDSKEGNWEDYLDDKRNNSIYDNDHNDFDDLDHDVYSEYERDPYRYEYDRDTTNDNHDYDRFDQDRYEYENNDYRDRDY